MLGAGAGRAGELTESATRSEEASNESNTLRREARASRRLHTNFSGIYDVISIRVMMGTCPSARAAALQAERFWKTIWPFLQLGSSDRGE
jgi:hypothetical protein